MRKIEKINLNVGFDYLIDYITGKEFVRVFIGDYEKKGYMVYWDELEKCIVGKFELGDEWDEGTFKRIFGIDLIEKGRTLKIEFLKNRIKEDGDTIKFMNGELKFKEGDDNE